MQFFKRKRGIYMFEDLKVEVVEFDEKLYQKNIAENNYDEKVTDMRSEEDKKEEK